ncbi:MAG: glycosyltransferase family 2 protein [Candidatus Omnitrophica bacterium]|nr:glycosyltransferase family 2 protein [Candidatus Omnitrophota bacterium]
MVEQVSIVIPAFNAGKTITQTIQACLNQDYAHVKEVIVIDDGSMDETGERVRAAGVSCVRQNNAGPAQARNKGAALAAGDVICFTDADCIPHPNWVRSLLRHFSDPAVGAVMGSYGIANPQSWLARAVYQEIMFRHRRMPVYPKVFGSYNVAIRKTVFDNVGGFNGEYPHASGEDNDLSYRILSCGYKIFFAKDALVDHHHPEMVKKYLREQYRHGFWRFKMYRAYAKMMRGDDYTFWKDSFEIFLSYCLLAALLLGIFSSFFRYVSISFILIIFIVEIFFSIKFKCDNIYILKYSYIMLVRTVARAVGFTAGGISTLLNRRRYPLIPR